MSFWGSLRPRALPPNAARTAGRPGVQAGVFTHGMGPKLTSTWHVFDATITWYRRSKVNTRFWDLAKNPTFGVAKPLAKDFGNKNVTFAKHFCGAKPPYVHLTLENPNCSYKYIIGP